MNKNAVIVSTYERTFTGDGNRVILKFADEKIDNFFLLFDNKNEIAKEKIAEHYPGINLCLYYPSDFINNGFQRPISKYHHWGMHQNPNYFYAHFRMLIFYLKNPNFEYYTFFDDDTNFTGSLKELLNDFSCNKDDFLAIQVFKKENYLEFPNVSTVNSRMGSGGHWLSFAPGPGDNYKSVTRHMGCFFPIVRFSNKAMAHLLELNKQDFFGYSEGFVPTSLASDGLTVSSMLDEWNKYTINTNSSCVLFHKGMEFTWTWI